MWGNFSSCLRQVKNSRHHSRSLDVFIARKINVFMAISLARVKQAKVTWRRALEATELAARSPVSENPPELAKRERPGAAAQA